MKKLFTLVIAAMCVFTGMARHINESEARIIAADKLGIEMKSSRLKSVLKSTIDEASMVYVFNAEKGFAVVAGDDRAPNMVLAYSPTGRIDTENCHPALKGWLEAQSAALASLDEDDVPAALSTEGIDFSHPVAPLCPTQWGQENPFDHYTPMVYDDNGDLVHAPTGCAATALAQILYYWKYPAEYKWDLMKTHYDKNCEMDEGAESLAQLNAKLGQYMKMNYTFEGSGATDDNEYLCYVDSLHLNPGIQLYSADNMPRAQWTQMIKDELDAGRPVSYGGFTKKLDGHRFVCDGYDADGKFHINWGWYGESDGYYQLELCNPEKQGTGGSPTKMAFDILQNAFFYLQPTADGRPKRPWTLIFDRVSISQDESTGVISLSLDELTNLLTAPFVGSLTIKLHHNETGNDIIAEVKQYTESDNLVKGTKLTVKIDNGIDGKNLTDGTYKVTATATDSQGNSCETYSMQTNNFDTFKMEGGKLVETPSLLLDLLEISFKNEPEVGYSVTDASRRATVTAVVKNLSTLTHVKDGSFKLTVQLDWGGFPYKKSYYCGSIFIPAQSTGTITIDCQLPCDQDATVSLNYDKSFRNVTGTMIHNTGFTMRADPYYELIIAGEPKLHVDAQYKPTISVPLKSQYTKWNLDGPTDYYNTVTCEISNKDGVKVATASADYDGVYDQICTLTMAFDQALEKGDYTARMIYTDKGKNERAVGDSDFKKEYVYSFTVSEPSGIDDIETDPKRSQRYNILGQPVDENYRGFVIVDGKKVIQQ